MKWALSVVAAVVVWVFLAGSPLATQQPQRGIYYASPEPILPMSFAHRDHTLVSCVECHHNYNDDTGHKPCMNCHVTDPELWQVFEQQFHDLCRGCHETERADGHSSGPPRQCIACHMRESVP